MSMNATDEVVSSSATFLATVDFPEPLPPAIPIIKGSNIVFERYEMHVGNALYPSPVTSNFAQVQGLR